MLGVPYSTYDCINFIKAVIRQASGGDKRYTTAGTNSLWRSKDLVQRWENLVNPVQGMLAFKASGEDVHHVGLVTGKRTVLHSSSAKGCVVETDLLNGQWHYLAKHRLIALEAEQMESSVQTGNTAIVATEHSGLRLRSRPETGVVLAEIPKGTVVEVLEDGTWPKVAYNGRVGYVSGAYLDRGQQKTADNGSNAVESGAAYTTLISAEDGRTVMLVGQWRIGND